MIARRTAVLLVAATLAWMGLGWRLYAIQVRAGPELARRAVSQRTLALPLMGRGLVLDRAGRPLHDPQPRTGVAVFPPLLGDRDRAARLLAPIIGRPEAAVRERLSAPGREPYWLAEDLPPEAAGRVAALGLPGVAVVPRTDRYGPAARAHHVVGYVNVAGGQLGLELAWDEALRGAAGPHLVAYLDGLGRPLAGLGIRQADLRAAKPPWDLHLTLDARVQAGVEAVLDRTPSPLQGAPLRAAVVVLDLQGDGVVAMASRPDFDPDRGPVGVDPQWAPLLNRAVTAYPPGSLVKPLIAAYALDQGLATLSDLFHCPGHYTLGDTTFWDSRAGGHGRITLGEAIGRSCNIAFIELGYERLGWDRLVAAVRAFGLGEPTGIGLPEEQAGFLPALEVGGDVVMLSFGQRLEVTPLQVARAYAALARGGTLPGLRLVEKVTGPGGEVMIRPRPPEGRPAVGPQAAAAVAAALRGVTDPQGHGTGRQAWVPGWGAAGKTGTAEASVHGRPTQHAWFAGWVPLHRPRYVIVVLVEEGASGGDAAAPLFRAIAEQVMAMGELP